MKTRQGAWAIALFLLLVGISSAGAGENGTRRAISFSKDQLDKLPGGWKSDHTGKNGGGVWKVVADGTAPSKKGFVLSQTGESPGPVFNLCIADNTRYRDMEVTVAFKANQGKRDQGGGVVWRYVDSNNYYIARYNPLEGNFRLYKVVDGKRMELASAGDIKIPAGEWHTLTIKMIGDQVECSLNGKKHLVFEDATFQQAGKVGLWTKADAQTSFDQFIIADLKK